MFFHSLSTWAQPSPALFLARLVRPLLGDIHLLQPIESFLALPAALYFVFPLLWVTFLLFFSVYDGKKNLKVIDEFSNLSLASLLAVVTLAGFLYLTYRDISRGFFILYILLTFVLLLLWRVLARALYKRRIDQLQYQTRIIIVGAGPVGLNIRQKLSTLQSDTFKFTGYIDDSLEKRKENDEIIGTIDEIKKLAQKKRVDHIIITLPRSAYERVNFVIKELETLPIRVSVIPDYFHLTMHRMVLTEFAGMPILDLRAPAISEYQKLIKRIFDILLTTLILIPALPVMLVISILIWIFDGWPIILTQNRVGENGKIIRIFKFRTMYRDADKKMDLVAATNADNQVVYKRKDDPRVTRFGKFLRRWSLDELPQLFNVMRGTLSLVGPRPELPVLVEKYETWQRARLSVPQGLTGWWQIQGRSDKPMHLHTEEDLYYINHYTLLLDISILIKTLWIVIRGKGAY